jgi:capsid protein
MPWDVESFVSEGMARLRDEWSMRNDYNAGKVSRFRRTRAGVGIIPRHADFHYRLEIEWFRMLEWMREFDRNDPIVGPGVSRAVESIVMSGMTPEPATPDAGLNRELKDRWEEYASDPRQVDIQGEANFHELEELVTRSVLVDGDLCSLPRRGGELETLEAHRLRSPLRSNRHIIHGVEVDEDRRRLAYWFTGEDVDPLSIGLRIGDVKRMDAWDADGNPNVFHVYRRKRISQTRGVSAIAPLVDIAGMFDDLQFSTLVKAQVAAAFVILKEYSAIAPGIPGAQTPDGSLTTETTPSGGIRTLNGVSPGMIVDGKPGQTMKGFAPNIPSPEFFPHSILLLTIMGINLGVPVTVLLLDPRLAGNFSSLRGIVDQARIGFAAQRRPIVQKWHRRVWRFRQLWLATSGRRQDAEMARWHRRLGESFFRCKWRHPRYPYLEPMADRAARILGTRNLLNSPRQGASEDSTDWQEIVEETVEDNSFALRAAIQEAGKINRLYPTANVSWKDLLALPTPDHISYSVAATEATSIAKETPEPPAAGQNRSAAGDPLAALGIAPRVNGHKHN